MTGRKQTSMAHKFREFQIVQTVRALPAEGDGDDGQPVAARDQGQAGTLEDMCAQAARALSASDYSGAWPEAAIAPGAVGTVVDLCGCAETGYGYFVEFLDDQGYTVALHCVKEEDLIAAE